MATSSYADRAKKLSTPDSPHEPAILPPPPASLAPSPSPSDPIPSANADKSVADSTQPTRPPPVNIWNQRKEQLAQQARAQTKPLQTLSQNTIQDKNTQSPTLQTSNGASTSGFLSRPPSNSSQNAKTNGARRVPPPPAVEDAESWPEVGKASATPPAKAARVVALEEKDEQEEKSDGTVSSAQSSSGANKKGERTKWVPLPPEEWQAPNPPPRSHRSQPSSRNGSQHPSHRQPPRPSGSGATSANISQVPSKAPSGYTSKASSVHSSPRRPTRGRPLPSTAFDSPALSGEPSTAVPHASRADSPRVFVETNIAAPVPHASIDPNVYRGEIHHPPPFFVQPHPHPPLHHLQPSPTQPYSPSSAPFQPPQHFHNGGFVPPPQLYPRHPGTPPYPMYPPYPYPYPPPYGVYWNGAPPDQAAVQNQYIPYAPQHTLPPQSIPALDPSLEVRSREQPINDIEASLPPPTMVSRPPPPDEVDVVAGYREVGPVSPSGVGDEGQMPSYVFGSTATAKEARSPSPVPPTRFEDRKVERVTSFTVGVVPGSNPPPLRSRTQSRHRAENDNVVDLTDPQVKLSFGTAIQSDRIGAEPTASPRRTEGLQLKVGANEEVPPGPTSSSTVDTTWEVRDYGYGFGRPGAPQQGSEQKAGPDSYAGRRRGGAASHYFPERGGFNERGSRRGRGGYGRGGAGGYGGGRGGYMRGGGRGQPPFTVTPPSQPFQPLPPPSTPPPVGLFIPPHAQAFFDPYAYGPPPVPAPVPPPHAPPPALVPAPPVMTGAALPQPRSQLAFPLDPMRYHLLGQLEYYLSPQNLAQDLFLRTKMDAKGWLPIALLASFKRVQTLTQHEALVHEVLALSRVVEVRAGHVRMVDGEWKLYVLPNAPASVVEPSLDGAPATEPVHVRSAEPSGQEGEEEEEEVEIVLGDEAARV